MRVLHLHIRFLSSAKVDWVNERSSVDRLPSLQSAGNGSFDRAIHGTVLKRFYEIS